MAGDPQSTLVIENRLTEFVRAEAWLAQLLDEWAIPRKLGFAIDLVLNEAVTNVICYAYEDVAPRPIAITLTNGSAAVVIEVVDDGKPFNPLHAPPMAVAEGLKGASIGGRGIHLIKSYADEQHYRRVGGRNRLTLLLRKAH